MTNKASFSTLHDQISATGIRFTQDKVVSSAPHPDLFVAQGIERVTTTQPGLWSDIEADLSVRALQAEPGVDNPFNLGETTSPAEWLIRSRLRFTVPDGVKNLEAGRHTVLSAYVLTADAPEELDNYFKEHPESDIYRSLQTPLATRGQIVAGVIDTAYRHDKPTKKDIEIASGIQDDPRANLIRNFIRDAYDRAGMAMLSATSDGALTARELPTTIDWLLNTTVLSPSE